jgi:hypothetical protein
VVLALNVKISRFHAGEILQPAQGEVEETFVLHDVIIEGRQLGIGLSE